MPTRIYEPPAGDSVADVETELVAGGRRQVMRAPQTEDAIAALRTATTDGTQLTRLADATTTTQRQKVNTVGAAHVITTEPKGGFPAISADAYAALQARQGSAFTSSSDRHDAGAVGSTTVRLTLGNPTGSGRMLWVYKLDLFSSNVTGYFSFLINPTGNLPTTARPINNHYVGHPNTSLTQARADVGSAMTGGTNSGIVIPVPSGSYNKVDLAAPYVISPGVTLALQATFSAATAAIVTCDWWEEAI